MKAKLILMISLSLIGIILFSCSNSTKQEPTQHQFMGYIENTQVNITGRLPGKISSIYVDEGDTVKQGDKIASLDTRELDANMDAMNSQTNGTAPEVSQHYKVVNRFVGGQLVKFSSKNTNLFGYQFW